MNRPKISRNSSSAARNQPLPFEPKGNANPRNPLTDLNVSASSTSVSAEAPKGCFRFLLSNSSSKSPLPRTPKSAPVPSKPRLGTAKKNSQNFNFDNPRNPRSKNLQKPTTRVCLQRKNDHKLPSDGNFQRQTLSENKGGCPPGNGMQTAEKSDRPAPKLPSRFRVVNPSLSEWKNGDGSISQGKFKRAPLARTDAGKAPSFSFLPVLEDNENPTHKIPSTSGFTGTSLSSGLIDTPINKVPSSGSYFVSTPETTTPPLQASVSPEIPDGVVGGLPSTPACFAAGHVLVGISDKRKCRPRGILTVQNEVQKSGSCKDRVAQDVRGFTNGAIFDRASLSPSPAQASINWISSPNKVQKDCNFKYNSPKLSGLGSTTVLVEDCFTPPSCDGFSKIAVGKRSLEFEGLEKPTTLVSEVTPPSSGNNLSRAAVYKGNAGNGPKGLDFEEPMGTKASVLEAKNIEGSVENGLLQFKGSESPNAPATKATKTSPSISLIPDGCSIENIRCQSLCCPNKTSFSWVLSPVKEHTGIRGYGSPQDKGLVGSAIFIQEASQCDLNLHRTSTTTSTTTAANNSCLSEFKTRSDARGYRYNLVKDSPNSGELWGSQNVICMPASSSKKHTSVSLISDYSDLDIGLSSMEEALQTVSSSTQSLLVTCETSNLVSDSSFQLSYPTTPSNSIDGTHLQRTNIGKASDVRISWREGLVSRIFEMDELDCCHWQSEAEDYGLLKPDISPDLRSSTLNEENDLQVVNGFGSPEYVDDQSSDGKSKLRVPFEPFGCAESISTDGGGLVASGDSDWTMCYKNQLFEI
ncbi:uncharacterized protein [Aristolochia californica]|uniref:uncharacterized protein n=1 Tax=Aristolochia californica TaxID=171875 RepID=UPI0035D59ECC